MPVIQCPMGDNGICQQPGPSEQAPAAVVTEGNISLLSQSLVNRLFPDGLPLNPEQAFQIEGITKDKYMTEILDSIFRPDLSKLQQTLMSTIGDSDGVLVPCSCGHLFVYRM